jgi:predicted HicB family RNase H-like nuclease
LWSLTRTQLNIKVDPELLKLLSAYPNRQSVTLTKFVAAVLAKAV